MSPGQQFHEDGSLPMGGGAGEADARTIFVFGSNSAGRHGLGAALVAKQRFGAKSGLGSGLHGRSYAIATKDASLRVLPIETIAEQVETFLEIARALPDLTFFVTRIGCGLAGYRDSQIAPLFRYATTNCSFARQWRPFIGDALGPLSALTSGPTRTAAEAGSTLDFATHTAPITLDAVPLRDRASAYEPDAIAAKVPRASAGIKPRR